MKTYAILGHPVAHSRSPDLHNAIFKKLGLKDRKYVYLDTEPQDLNKVMKELVDGKYEGFSVTLPYKEEVMEYCDEVSDRAWKVGAVNTVVKKDGKILGDNTDYLGFRKSLEEAGVEGNGRALVLGSGGVARAVIAVLIDLGFRVEVASLYPNREEDLMDDFQVIIKGYDELEAGDDCELIVNCTPVGMKKGDEALLKDKEWYLSDRVYADVIYTPVMTEFLKRAKAVGAKVVTGDRMFLWQAVEQAKYFCGRDDVDLKLVKKTFDLLDRKS